MTQTTLHRIIFSLLLCLFFSTISVAQTPVSFCVTNATDNGNGVTIAVTTENFTDIVSAQFTVEWNPNDLELISTGNFNPILNIQQQVNFTPPSISNPTGLMGFTWIDNTLVGQTLAPGSILFSLTFTVNNNNTTVSIGNSLAVIEVSNSNMDLVPVDTKTGTVNATGGTIFGNLFNDSNSDCLLTAGEMGLENRIIKIENSQNTFFATSDVDGNFSAFVPLGTYDVSIENQQSYWESCTPLVSVSLVNSGGMEEIELPIKAAINCPALEINIESSSLAKCTDNNIYTIDYCNLGTVTAVDPFIEITLDEHLSIVSSPISFSDLGDDTYSFDIADLAINDCNSFQIVVAVSCDVPDGITHCAMAHIFPDNNCSPTDPNWSGASLKVSGECNIANDSVIFTIQNKGMADMMESSVYIVIEDAVLLFNGSPIDPIPSNGTRTFSFPAEGETYRMEAKQVNFHPGMSMPSATVEGCGASTGSLSTGFVNQFSQDEGDPFIAIDCRENIAANIVNTKEAMPIGFGSDHFIEPNTDIEYLIRFQNTGTDSIVDLIVRDTLSEFLDASSVRAITSSHPYLFGVDGEGVVTFKFPNINLTNNSSIDESSGFVKFKVSQEPDVPLMSVIENKSAIHFGFNTTILTNTVFHTVNENYISVKTEWVSIPNLAVKVYPNPSRDVVHFEVKGHDFETIELKLFDLRGSLIHSATSPNELFTFHPNDIPAGVYAFSLSSDGALLSTGKLIIK